MKDLCVVAVVNEGYQEYIPLFIYFTLYAYPSYDVLIYLDGSLHPEVRACLDAIRHLGSFDVRPLPYRYDCRDTQNLMALRWVLHDDDFDRYDNIYIGDVDLLTAREEPSLCARRLRHSDEIGRPYSNRIRRGDEKLSGLHFVRTHAYYPHVRPAMQRYRDIIEAGVLRLHNETVLYRIISETVGLPETRGDLPLHHGIHLRVFDQAHTLAAARARRDYLFEKIFERYFDAFLDAACSDGCVEIMNRLSRIESSPERLAAYPRGGPAAGRQLAHVLALCNQLIEERARRAP